MRRARKDFWRVDIWDWGGIRAILSLGEEGLVEVDLVEVDLVGDDLFDFVVPLSCCVATALDVGDFDSSSAGD